MNSSTINLTNYCYYINIQCYIKHENISIIFIHNKKLYKIFSLENNRIEFSVWWGLFIYLFMI